MDNPVTCTQRGHITAFPLPCLGRQDLAYMTNFIGICLLTGKLAVCFNDGDGLEVDGHIIAGLIQNGSGRVESTFPL